MATRKYKRNRNGQFSSTGTSVTVGRAGGFANAAHRAAVQQKRVKRQRRRVLAQRAAKGAAVALGGALAAGVIRRSI